uniref:C-X-C motif chemokine n=1 Tax=Oryctolagus cuniculus TaxID=9986 RepID=A0A5F9C5M3_RABIT
MSVLPLTATGAEPIPSHTMWLSLSSLRIFISFSHAADFYESQELRCQCIQIYSNFISPKLIKNVQMIPSGPYCSTKEVIATLKSGQEACLNPAAPMVKKFLQKRLSKGSSN